jgi:hypothetical protein
MVHQFIRDIEQFDRLQLPVFTGVTIWQNAGIYYSLLFLITIRMFVE